MEMSVLSFAAYLYFAFGIGFYIGMTVKDPMGFVDASVAGILRGLLLGIVFWPVGIVVAVWLSLTKFEEIEEEKEKVSIRINGTVQQVNVGSISYEDLGKLAGLKSPGYSVVYRGKRDGQLLMGSVIPGNSVTVAPDMTFNVVYTGNA